MFIGAAIIGLLTTFLVEIFNKHWNVQEDASMGIVFTSLFAIGVILISFYAGNVDLDQECVLYGEIAYTPFDLMIVGGQEYGPRPVWILGSVFIINLMFIILFYKELLITSFDSAMAVSIGINASLIHYLLMAAVSVTTVASFESVGSILVVAMLIVPGASAYLWTDKLSKMLIISVAMGIISAFFGYLLAAWWDSSIAGAMSVVLGLIFISSALFAPQRGVVSKKIGQIKLSIQMVSDHILLELRRFPEIKNKSEMLRHKEENALIKVLAFRSLFKLNLLVESSGLINLSESGIIEADKRLRGHRLWETFMGELGLPPDHLHDPADQVEHFLTEPIQKQLAEEIKDVKKDPHGKDIPALWKERDDEASE